MTKTLNLLSILNDNQLHTAYRPNSNKSIKNLPIETDTCWHIGIRSLMSVRLRVAENLIVMLARWDDIRRIITAHWCLRQQHPHLLRREIQRHRHLHKINQTARLQIIHKAAAHQQLRTQVYHQPQQAVILVTRSKFRGDETFLMNSPLCNEMKKFF